MSSDIQSSRNRWMTGLLIIAIFLLLAVIFIILYLQNRSEGSGPRVGYRSPIAGLAYCGPQDDGLCVVSFSQIEGGAMQVNFQVPHPFYPEFLLIINRYGVENIYECHRDRDLDTRVTCMGAPQVPGEVLQFILVSKNRGTWLAEGKFSIVGIAISTPEVIPTATTTPTVTPTRRTPTPAPSYPNPSYP